MSRGKFPDGASGRLFRNTCRISLSDGPHLPVCLPAAGKRVPAIPQNGWGEKKSPLIGDLSLFSDKIFYCGMNQDIVGRSAPAL